jgi:hypothetical protein
MELYRYKFSKRDPDPHEVNADPKHCKYFTDLVRVWVKNSKIKHMKEQL